MRKLVMSIVLAFIISMAIPEGGQGSDRVRACVGVNCGTLGNSLCDLAWWPNDDGTVTWYWCVMVNVVGEEIPIPQKA